MFNIKEAISKIEERFGYKVQYDPNKNIYLLWYSNDPTKPSAGRFVTLDEIYNLAKD